jgi:hypothetical protein
LGRQTVHIDALFRKLGQDFFAIAAVRRHDLAEFATIRDSFASHSFL